VNRQVKEVDAQACELNTQQTWHAAKTTAVRIAPDDAHVHKSQIHAA
jgi:hypothetical protein